MLGGLMLLQAVATQPPVRPDRLRIAPCPTPAAGELVVCGKAEAEERYRLRPLPEKYDRPPVGAQTGIARNTVAAVETEQKVIGGVPSNRIMARLKIAF